MKYVIMSPKPYPAFWFDRLVNGRWQEGWTANLEHARKYTESNKPLNKPGDQVVTLEEARAIVLLEGI